MKKRIALLLCLIALLNFSHIAFADSPAVADASQMATVEEVVEPGMSPVYAEDLADGEYGIAFKCSSSMFRIDSALLKVHEGKMEAVLTMGSKSFLYVWPGSAEEAAAAAESAWIAPVEAGENCATPSLLSKTTPLTSSGKESDLTLFRTTFPTAILPISVSVPLSASMMRESQ